ncbi:MAG: hypothetical protein DHS20C16_02110 [Phycisphaerae bacterium]|nr:MAG: hypothetical protein DHS20C16_02110 [Phycisphaerae bacterium]
MRSKPLLILDADGVFMDEMPYWNTALATLMYRFDLQCADTEEWVDLSRTCLNEYRVQAITKGRGCNSNWDLAAVMIRAAEDGACLAGLGEGLRLGDCDLFATSLAEGMERQWRSVDSGDPLGQFGIERDEDFFQEVVAEFQQVFKREVDVDWDYDRQVPVLPVAELRALFLRFKEYGFTLGVCTSRAESEIVEPMTQFGVLDCFQRDRIVTYDHAVRAESRTGNKAMGKPHPFPLLCAAIGFDAALLACERGASQSVGDGGEVVYVGDAPADFDTAHRAAELGLSVSYVHIDSGLAPPADREAIADSDITKRVAPTLVDCESWLRDYAGCVGSRS